MWMLRRLKHLGASKTEMMDVYSRQVRCVLEMVVAVWEPGLTKAQGQQLERVQKCAFYVVLGEEFSNYENALKVLGNEKLSDRRTKLCLIFARKSEKLDKFQHWFKLAEERSEPLPDTRSDKT